MESRSTETKTDNDFLPVLVLGRPGSGKSTLINYLLGKKMHSIKNSGTLQMVVADGDSRPFICHTLLNLGTTQLEEYKDTTKKISYYDTPAITITTDVLHNENNAIANIKQISQLINQIKIQQGVIIVAFSVDNLEGPAPHEFAPMLDLLCENTKITDCHILFTVTKIDKCKDDLTSSDMNERAKELLQHYQKPPAIAKKMKDVNNWIAVNMLTPKSYQLIHLWIEKITRNKKSSLTLSVDTPTSVKVDLLAKDLAKSMQTILSPRTDSQDKMVPKRKLLVLDVEGTIITGYDFTTELDNNTFPAIIDNELQNILKIFAAANFDIVLATGTSGENLKYYENEFKKAGIDTLIKKYSPQDHSNSDSKSDKLLKYTREFHVSNKQDVYFFDDGASNVENAQKAGFCNSFRVTDQNSLLQQLEKLLDNLQLSARCRVVDRMKTKTP